MTQHTRDIVVVGASAGGVDALQRLVAGLPADFPAAVFVVQHIWAGSESFLAPILDRAGPLQVAAAVQGEPVQKGTIRVAPVDMHLMIEHDRIAVVRGPRENRARPAINPLFRSAAAAYQNRVIGIILTGTLDDGTAGLWAIKQCGGIAIVQADPAFKDMPQSAVENVEVDYHVPLDDIPPLLSRLTQERVAKREPKAIPELIKINDDAAKMKPTGFELDEVGRHTVFTCPECHGALWEIENGGLQYRCHVGHAYTATSLGEQQAVALEESLWSALRALKESAALDERVALRAKQHNLDKAEQLHRHNASRKMEHAARLQEFLAQFRVAT